MSEHDTRLWFMWCWTSLTYPLYPESFVYMPKSKTSYLLLKHLLYENSTTTSYQICTIIVFICLYHLLFCLQNFSSVSYYHPLPRNVIWVSSYVLDLFNRIFTWPQHSHLCHLQKKQAIILNAIHVILLLLHLCSSKIIN